MYEGYWVPLKGFKITNSIVVLNQDSKDFMEIDFSDIQLM